MYSYPLRHIQSQIIEEIPPKWLKQMAWHDISQCLLDPKLYPTLCTALLRMYNSQNFLVDSTWWFYIQHCIHISEKRKNEGKEHALWSPKLQLPHLLLLSSRSAFPLILMSFMGVHPVTYLDISLIRLCHVATPATEEVHNVIC